MLILCEPLRLPPHRVRATSPSPAAGWRYPDPHEAQITRLKAENAELGERLTPSEQTISELKNFRTQTPARLAAQHEEIVRLREAAAGTSRVSRLPAPRTTVIGTCSRGGYGQRSRQPLLRKTSR